MDVCGPMHLQAHGFVFIKDSSHKMSHSYMDSNRQLVRGLSRSLRSVHPGAEYFSISWGNVPQVERESSTHLDMG